MNYRIENPLKWYYLKNKMGAFICAISERDWDISRRLGIYGNKGGSVKDSKYVEFKDLIKLSIIRDLIGMKKGDLIFFHVLSHPGAIHGVYQCKEEPFLSREKIWKDDLEIFPYRFLFEPSKRFADLANNDASISVIDFYELIEQRKIWSLATLENEMNLEARSVRKIESNSEANEIVRLLIRDNNKELANPIKYENIVFANTGEKLRGYISRIGNIENAIKALLMFEFANKTDRIEKIFGPVNDFMNEVFIAQTTRKSMDLLCINDGLSKSYTIIEAKTDCCDKKSLKQLLYYLDLFIRKDLFIKGKDKVQGCLIGQSFHKDVIDFVKANNYQNIENKIILLRYFPIDNFTNAELLVFQ